MSAGYPVPKSRVRVELRVSNSRFIATVDRAERMDEAQALLREIRAEMPDATHHVYAFRIGHGASVSERLSDDREPSGTAGPPAMAVLRGSGVGDVALVITRYFGGTKLGAGGLVAAYTQAAQAALAALKTERKVTRIACECTAPYALLDPLRRALSRAEAVLDEPEYGSEVVLRFQVPQDRLPELRDELADMSAGRVEIRTLDAPA